MIKIFITDLDGTLIYKAQSHINPSLKNKIAIKKLIEKDIKFAIATGRLENSILDVEKKIEIPTYKISVNGAVISDTENKNIYSSYIKSSVFDQLKLLLEKKYKKNIYYYVIVTDKGSNYFKPFNPISNIINLFYKKRFNTRYLDEKIIKNLKNSSERVLKINLGVQKEKKYNIVKNIQKDIEDAEVFITGHRSVEIGPKGNSKGEAILKLLDYLGLDTSEAAYIGDSYNDLSGFEVCKYSFVMSHADNDVKKMAKYQVNHVYEAIDKILKINKESD